MIIRQLSLRHGRKAFAKPAAVSWRRALASAVEEHTKQFDRVVEPSSLGFAQRPVDETQVQVQSKSAKEASMEAYARQYWEMEEYKKKTGKIGAHVTDDYKPFMLVNHPPSPSDITLELLMASQAHLGHATGLWHPGNARYIYGIRDGIHIISLDATAAHLRRACKIVEDTAAHAGLILFVGTRSGQDRSVVKAAELAGGCHLFDRWIPGSITNRIQILGNCRTKVVNEFDGDVTGFEEQLGQQGPIKPDLVVCLNPLENHVLLRECNQHNIPTIGVVDTDCNPALVTYPIPANDDSRRCTNVIAGVLGRAAETGRLRRLAFTENFNQVTYPRRHSLRKVGDTQENGVDGGMETTHAPGDEGATAKTSPDGSVEPADPQADFAKGLEEERLQAAVEMFNLSDLQDASPETIQPMLEKLSAADAAGANASTQNLQDPMKDEEFANADKYHKSLAMSGYDMSAPVRGESRAATMEKMNQAADPILARLVALKRRAMGERLSASDRAVLKDVEKEEAATRTEVEKGRKQLLEQVEREQQKLEERIQSITLEGNKRAEREVKNEVRAKETARREEKVVYGAVGKNRRGRPDERS